MPSPLKKTIFFDTKWGCKNEYLQRGPLIRTFFSNKSKPTSSFVHKPLFPPKHVQSSASRHQMQNNSQVHCQQVVDACNGTLVIVQADPEVEGEFLV